jgi:succinate dehydrogenase/fumarate reductase iron-sulfur protein
MILKNNFHYIKVSIFSYDPLINEYPYIKTYTIQTNTKVSLDKLIKTQMVLDLIIGIQKFIDQKIAFRRSCREGICGSCGMNINTKNILTCTSHIKWKNQNMILEIFPIAHMNVLKHMVINMNSFFKQYKYVIPYMIQKLPKKHDCFIEFILNKPYKEIKQSKIDRFLLNGLYECILCACCSSSCPSYWWNKEKYIGPAILLQAYRWIIDSRDDFFLKRIYNLEDMYKITGCHIIGNCIDVCPKNLNPATAIANLSLISKRILLDMKYV